MQFATGTAMHYAGTASRLTPGTLRARIACGNAFPVSFHDSTMVRRAWHMRNQASSLFSALLSAGISRPFFSSWARYLSRHS